ncbi:MAG: zf-HC2 domain-containing protein [Planctomycetaceae bacterium]|nr:MAG: zf-HC2 domain-containing protein [Planctomycetaceae bacterium]
MMNCAECKELLVVYQEGLLEESQEQAILEHLGKCEMCRAELAGLQTLQQRLVNNGKALAQSDLEDDVMNRIIREQNARLKAADQASAGLRIRRLIMKSPITKLAIAAAVIVVAAVSLQFLGGGPAAYALEQTINANHSVRYLHIKIPNAEPENEPKELWIACDENGQVQSVRFQSPEWASPEDGAKWVVWNQGIAKIWFKRKNSFLICRDETVQKWILDLVRSSDPRYAVERLSEQEKQGKLTLDIQQPDDKSQPIIITAIYAPDGKSPGRQVVFHVDQSTKLVTVIEYYHQGPDGQLTFTARQENYDYNVPIAADMFVLDDEVPADVMRVDQVAQDVGLPQGNMTDEQVVVEVVRQFFEALKTGDYDKAGMLLGGLPAKDTQKLLGDLKVVGIVSIGEPKPHPIPGVGGFVVPCKVEVENPDGSKSIKEYSGVGVRPVDRNRQADRWNIHGGI